MEALAKVEELDLFKEEVAKIRTLSESIVVESIDDTIPMEMAKTLLKQTNMALKKIEAKRKELKEDSLRTGQKIDEIARGMRGDLEKIATNLQEKVNYEKIWKEEKLVKLFEVRNLQVRANNIGTEFTLGKEFTKDHGFMQLSDEEFSEFIEDSVNKKLAETRRQEALANRMLVAGELHDFMTVDFTQCSDEEFTNDLKAAHERKIGQDKKKKESERAQKMLMYSDALPEDKSFINSLSDEDFDSSMQKAMNIISMFNSFKEGVRVMFGPETREYPTEYFHKAYDFHREFGDGKGLLRNISIQRKLREKVEQRRREVTEITTSFDFYELYLEKMPTNDEEYPKWVKDLRERVEKQQSRIWIVTDIAEHSQYTETKLWKLTDQAFEDLVEKEKSYANTVRTEKRIKQIDELKETVRIETSIESLRTMTDEEWDLVIKEKLAEKRELEAAGEYGKAVDYSKRLREVEIPEFTHPSLVANIKKLIEKIEVYVYEKTKEV